MYKCRLRQDAEENDVILIRVYGPGTENCVDRDRECLVMRMVHSAGLGAQVYCRFNNGMAYKFLRGTHLTENNIKDESIARAVAQKLASLHELDIRKILIDIGEQTGADRNNEPFKVSDDMRKFMTNIPEQYSDALKSKVRKAEFPSVEKALAMVENLEYELSAMAFPTALIHRDPNPYNTIHDPVTGEIYLVDWEFSGIHYPPMDLGAYFVGVWLMNDCAEESLALYPDKEYQLKWIRWYLEYQAELTGKDPDEITADQVLHWYRGAVNCSLQWTQFASFYFLMQDGLSKSDSTNFRRARNVQSLFYIVLNDHYRKLSSASTDTRK